MSPVGLRWSGTGLKPEAAAYGRGHLLYLEPEAERCIRANYS